MGCHAELLTRCRLLLLLPHHLPLQHGLLVRLLLQIVRVKGVLILHHGELVVHHGVRLRGVHAQPSIRHQGPLCRHL